MTLDAEKAGVPVVPERIWITVNGKRSTYPGGGWYLIGGWEANDWKANSIPYVPASALDTARAEIERLRHDNEMLTTGGIIEVAVRNPSVADYMRHWEGRAEKAESALTAAQERIAELEGALKPFALISSEGVVTKGYEGFATITTSADYFHRAAATLSPAVKENDRGEHVP